MAILIRRSLIGLVLSMLLAACTEDVRHVAATSVLVRVTASDEIMANLSALRVRVAFRTAESWQKVPERTFSSDALVWPVDLAIASPEPNNPAVKLTKPDRVFQRAKRREYAACEATPSRVVFPSSAISSTAETARSRIPAPD